MKKLLSVLIMIFLLAGCSEFGKVSSSDQTNQSSTTTTEETETTTTVTEETTTTEEISQATLETLKQEIKAEILEELQSQYASHLSDTEAAINLVVQNQAETVLGVSNFQYDSVNSLNETSTGSGVIYKKITNVDSDNAYYLVSNHHVVADADKLQVVLPNREYVDATLIGSDELSDLAVLKFFYSGDLPTVEFANSDDLKLGQFVIAVGNPLGYDYYRTITLGILSGYPELMSNENSEWDALLQHDAAINPGNSGGALFDIQGNLIGINNMKIVELKVDGINFAIPANTVQYIIENLEEYGRVIRPFLGIGGYEINTVRNLDLYDIPEDITHGIYISEIYPNSGAAEADLKVSDIIVEVEGTKVQGFNDLKSIINQSNVGDVLSIKVNRNGSLLDFNVTLKER